MLVVGAGPIGLETAAVLTAQGLRVRIIDAGPIGATIHRLFPPHTRFFTSPERLELFGLALSTLNQEKMTGEEYLQYLRAYVAQHQLQVDTFTTIEAIDTEPITVRARALSGRAEVHTANALVLATGGTHRPRRLGVPGEDLPHVRSHLGDPHRYVGRRVLIVGGRNSAVESALRCYRVGAQVHMCHRDAQIHDRVKFWLRPEVVSLLAEGRITGHMPDEIERITADAVWLREAGELVVDDVLLQIGYEHDGSIFEMAGVRTAGGNGAPRFDPDTMATDVPGVYVVGTATAGTQEKFEVFIENSHDHALRVAAAMAGQPVPPRRPARPVPEV